MKKIILLVLMVLFALSIFACDTKKINIVEKNIDYGDGNIVKEYKVLDGDMKEDNYENWTMKNFPDYFKNQYDVNKASYKIMENTEYENEVIKIEGKEKGKTIYCICSVHGDERAGFVAGNLMKNITIEKGIMYILSPANIYGSIYNTRETKEGLNINRSFPGDGDGDAYFIAKNIFEDVKEKNPDIIMDLHEGYKHYKGYDNLGNSIIVNNYDDIAELSFGILDNSEQKELYKRFNADFTYYATPPEGSVNKVINELLHIPVITIETNREEPLYNRVEKQLDIVEYVVKNQDLY